MASRRDQNVTDDTTIALTFSEGNHGTRLSGESAGDAVSSDINNTPTLAAATKPRSPAAADRDLLMAVPSVDAGEHYCPGIEDLRLTDVTSVCGLGEGGCVSPSIAGTGDEDECPDFSQLPELVWVKVFQLLSLGDRYRLSQVNWFFNSMFYDGAVWRKMTIHFSKALVHGYFYMASYKLTLPETSKKLAWKFGHFFRDVTLRVRGRPEEIEVDTRQILSHLQQKWRLESLTLDIGDREWGNRYQGVEFINLSLLMEVATILRESTSLRHLHILHWPHAHWINEESFHLNQVLPAAECLKLRTLRLPRTSENVLQTLAAPRELALQAVARFRCLSHLYVTSDMLSEALFHALVTSRDAPFCKLSIEVNGFWSTGFLDHLLSPLSWAILSSQDAGRVEVDLTISADVPEFVFARFLVPEIPLVAVTFDINCHCYRKAFQLMHQYSETLRSFRCFSQPEDCELHLLDMVRACSRLRHLHYHGAICDYNVLKLAECRAGKASPQRRWGEFSFLWRSIEKTCQRPTPFNLISSSKGRRGSHCLRDDQAGSDDNDPDDGDDSAGNAQRTEEEVKAEFCQQVSKRLGFPWEPLIQWQ